jgi:hypothetical protein
MVVDPDSITFVALDPGAIQRRENVLFLTSGIIFIFKT